MSTKQFMGNVSWSMLSHLFSRGSMMLSAMLLARSLSASDFATYSYFQLTCTMIATYSALGLGVTASKFFAELNASKISDSDDSTKLIGTLWVLSILLSLTAALIVLVIPNSILSSGLNISTLLFSLCVLVMALDIVPSGGILGLEKYKQVALISFISGVVGLSGVIFSIKLNQVIYSMWSLILSCLIQLIGEVYVIYSFSGSKNFKKLLIFDKSKVKNVLKFVGPMMFVSIMAGSSAWILGRLILNGNNGNHNFALYSIGLQWFALALFIPGMISRVLLPRLIRSSPSEHSNTLYLAGSVAIAAASVFAVIGYIFGDTIISVYGSNYDSSKNLIFAYLVAAVLYAPANTLGNALVAHGKQNIWLFVTFIWFVITVSAAVFFKESGAWMGAYAQIIGGSSILMLSIFFCKKDGVLK